MGVHGLTTYLREHKRVLSKTIKVPSGDDTPIHIVVDAWSLVYALHQRCNLPWVYGGEYGEFAKLVVEVVSAWISVGLKVSFVFDGPYPQIKFPTLVSRASKSIIEPSLLFFRTSAASRSAPHFLRETRIIPPAYYAATLHALDTLRSTHSSLDVHFADEECDPYAVELAGRLGGYVVGTDSDFVILNAEGYRGYIPLDEMVWTAVTPEPEQEAVDDDGFQQVSNAKSRTRALKATSTFGKGIIPPETANISDLSLSCSVFSPVALADHLSLPVTLLPLLASLAGNDFTNQDATSRINMHAFFFERSLSPVQRIDRVASTIQSILAPVAKRKAKHQVGSVMDLIDRTVNALTAKIAHTMGPGQIDIITDKIAEGALQYAIPKYEGEHEGEQSLWPTRMCALHSPDICPALPFYSRALEMSADEDDEDEEELSMRIQIRTRYLDAYRKAQFPPLLMNCLTTGTYWSRLFIEDPDLETVSRLARPIRQWCYAILDQALGLPVLADEAETQDDAMESDDDEIVDVVESDSDLDAMDETDSDLLAPLRGALQNLRNPDTSPASTARPTGAVRTRIITEYLRRGTRLADEAVEVPAISELLPSISDAKYDFTTSTLPLVVQPDDVRLTVLLRALRSDVPGIRELSPVQVSAVLVLRWVLQTLHDRAEESGHSKAREAERWTAREARCFLASFAWDGEALPSDAAPIVQERHVQLTFQVLHGCEAVGNLAQALLLYPGVASPVHLFSGRSFHSYLTGAAQAPEVPGRIWDACQAGLGQVFAEERKKKKKNKGGAGAVSHNAAPNNKRTNSGGMFGMLGDM